MGTNTSFFAPPLTGGGGGDGLKEFNFFKKEFDPHLSFKSYPILKELGHPKKH